MLEGYMDDLCCKSIWMGVVRIYKWSMLKGYMDDLSSKNIWIVYIVKDKDGLLEGWERCVDGLY